MGYKDIIAIPPGTVGLVILHGKQYLIDKTTTRTKVMPYEENTVKENKQETITDKS